jgi:hypothetical protein
MRNITTQFELFENENKTLQKVTIECQTSNPDWESQFTVYGIGRDKREAAIFALSAAWMIYMGEISDSDIIGKKVINDLKVASSFLDGNTNLEDDVNAAQDNELDTDYFGDHGTDSEVSLYWEEIISTVPYLANKGASMMRSFGKPSNIDEIGGYVVSMTNKENSYDEDDEEED